MTTTTKDAATILREPFQPQQIGKLPRSTCRACSDSSHRRCDQHQWVSRCPECKRSHTSAVIHLDYVGHAATTDRLLKADSAWTWEPLAFDQMGLPLLDQNGGLWIRLTVHIGDQPVTRLGYGDAAGKRGANAVKEAIGDALRNAAMRFGVALDLWAKEDLADADAQRNQEPDRRQVLLDEIAAAADAAGVPRKQVSEEWAAAHNGQYIAEATALGDLELMRDDLRTRKNETGDQ